jgi:hypothetical protein
MSLELVTLEQKKHNELLVVMSLGPTTLEQKNMTRRSSIPHHHGLGDLQQLNQKNTTTKSRTTRHRILGLTTLEQKKYDDEELNFLLSCA